jgi:histidinol-phosphate/aromatic aminotransferase/cobyric acid decarboxylase-like protein
MFCRCQCKLCRTPDARHCRAHASCGVPTPDRAQVGRALRLLKSRSGTHSPSVGEIERALPGLVQIDACFLSNPYATDVAMARLRALDQRRLELMVSHYPAQGAGIAELLAGSVGVPAGQLFVANGACEVIQAALASAPGPVLLAMPTFSAYYELARGPLVEHRLQPDDGFALDLDALDALVEREAPATVVVINPNNPTGGLVEHDALVEFVTRLRGRVRQVIVDESFLAFASEEAPPSLAPLVTELPHLVVVNSLSKSHGIAGLRLGYAVMAEDRVRRLRAASLWNLNAYAEWFCGLLGDPDYQREYEAGRRRYVRDGRRLFDALGRLPGVTAFPTAANFALLELDRPAAPVAAELLAAHGVYVRDCADKRGLEGGRFLRVAARSETENARIAAALRAVLRQARTACGFSTLAVEGG